jgi:hypothetical protein
MVPAWKKTVSSTPDPQMELPCPVEIGEAQGDQTQPLLHLSSSRHTTGGR